MVTVILFVAITVEAESPHSTRVCVDISHRGRLPPTCAGMGGHIILIATESRRIRIGTEWIASALRVRERSTAIKRMGGGMGQATRGLAPQIRNCTEARCRWRL